MRSLPNKYLFSQYSLPLTTSVRIPNRGRTVYKCDTFGFIGNDNAYVADPFFIAEKYQITGLELRSFFVLPNHTGQFLRRPWSLKAKISVNEIGKTTKSNPSWGFFQHTCRVYQVLMGFFYHGISQCTSGCCRRFVVGALFFSKMQAVTGFLPNRPMTLLMSPAFWHDCTFPTCLHNGGLLLHEIMNQERLKNPKL